MKRIKIACWFTDSEIFIAKLILKHSFKVTIRKVISPIDILMHSNVNGEKYEMYGYEEEINKLIEVIHSEDLDIEIYEDEQV